MCPPPPPPTPCPQDVSGLLTNVLSLHVLPRMAPQYKDLDIFGQLSVTTNVTYALMMILQLVPYTVCMVGVLFGDSEAKDYPSK